MDARNEYWRQYRQRVRVERRKNNLCAMCGGMPLPGKTRCGGCIEKDRRLKRVYSKQDRIWAIETGHCSRCFKKLDPEIDEGRKLCHYCRANS